MNINRVLFLSTELRVNSGFLHTKFNVNNLFSVKVMHKIKVADRLMDRDHNMTTSTIFGMLFLKVGLCHNQTV